MIPFFLGGDFRYFFSENIPDFINFPFAWDSSLNTGIGQSQIGSLWIIAYFNFTAFFSKLGLSWSLIQLIFWVVPALLLSFLSSFYLFKILFKLKVQYSILSGIIYTFNTYFLMILTGGQLGVALAYSLAPLVLLRFIKIIENPSLRNVLIAGLVLALQLVFDPRIVYVSLVAVFLYVFFNFSKLTTIKQKMFFLAPFLISILINIFWILPLILTKSSPIPEGFNSVKGFEFFSFSDFSHALSLLHPNWPENIFGKTYFLQPEFLILPIIAYISLLFISTIKNPAFAPSILLRASAGKQNSILFLATLGLLGAFLAKGASPPFGEINIWLFQYFPGMVMFRDPTKWYILIALSYSILIPLGLYSLQEWLISKIKNQKSKIKSKYQIFNISYAFLLFAILYLVFLIRPLWFGELKEKFKPREVPKEYVLLKDFLVSKPEFFRTLWIPQWQRFGYFSNNHPAIGREELFKGDYKKQIEQLKKSGTEQLFRELNIKYVIIPYDSEEEIFLIDRKYDEDQYRKAIAILRKVTWLRELIHLGKIHVFELINSKDHFWSSSLGVKIDYESINPTEYKIQVRNAKQGDLLIFSEGFDRNWIAQNSEGSLRSSKYKNLNSFRLHKNGDYMLRIYYEPQRHVEAGLWLSLATFLASIGYLAFGKIRKKW